MPLIFLTIGVVAFAEWWTGMWDPELYGQQQGVISSQRKGSDGPPPGSKSRTGRKGARKKADADSTKADAVKSEEPASPEAPATPPGHP